jgi:2OG-Fe(II) oxygenase superfamily
MTPVLLDFINRCAAEEADPDRILHLLEQDEHVSDAYYRELERLSANCYGAMGGNIFLTKLMTPAECDALLDNIAEYDFAPNLEEGVEYRIEEAVLETVDPGAYESLKEFLLPVLNAYCLMINSTPITKVVSFQIAKYRPEGTPGTGWHHDKESDFTAVISLNPENFEGGGTGFRMAPHATVDVPPLAKGQAVMFNGRSVQHRGLPVTSGERLLLVCWCSTK